MRWRICQFVSSHSNLADHSLISIHLAGMLSCFPICLQGPLHVQVVLNAPQTPGILGMDPKGEHMTLLQGPMEVAQLEVSRT